MGTRCYFIRLRTVDAEEGESISLPLGKKWELWHAASEQDALAKAVENWKSIIPISEDKVLVGEVLLGGIPLDAKIQGYCLKPQLVFKITES